MVKDSYHLRLERMIERKIETGIELLKTLPVPAGKLASGVEVWPIHLRLSSDSGKIIKHQDLMFGNISAAHPTLVFQFAEFGNASKHAQVISLTKGMVKTVVSLQLSWPIKTWLGDPKKMAHFAANSFVWVWKADEHGSAHDIVRREPLSTPDGQIGLWLSDFVSDKPLAKELSRPLER